MSRVSNVQLQKSSEYVLNKGREKNMKSQEQISSLRRLNRLSDDPLAVSQSLTIRSKDIRDENIMRSSAFAETFLNASESSLTQINEILMRAKELALSQANDGTSTPEGRLSVASEVRELRAAAIQLANSRMGSRFLFSGFKANTLPFDDFGNYQGDDGVLKVEVAPQYFIDMNVPGSKVFKIENYQERFVEEPKRKSAEFKNSKTHEIDQDEIRFQALRKEPKPMTERNDLTLFELLKGLQTALEENDTETIRSTLDPLDDIQAKITLFRTEIGARTNAIKINRDFLDTQKFENKKLLSDLEDVDVVQSFSDIEKNENVLKVSLMTAQKILQPSLIEFLK